MDRAELQRRLQKADRRVEHAEHNIAQQRSMIETLERGGHDTRAANLFLRWLMAVQARALKERDRLLNELSQN